jgi:hypothetical protein
MRLAFTLCLCGILSVSQVLAEPIIGGVNALSEVPITGIDVATPGGTNSCGWSATMEDDEGGPVMVASSCQSDTESGPAFRLLCGEQISIRYDGFGVDASQHASGTLFLTSGGKSLEADVVYEEMDGAFAAYVEKDSPIIALLKTGDKVGVTFERVDLAPRLISLKGSSAAIDTLISTCN